jgi:hypothetical protein
LGLRSSRRPTAADIVDINALEKPRRWAVTLLRELADRLAKTSWIELAAAPSAVRGPGEARPEVSGQRWPT